MTPDIEIYDTTLRDGTPGRRRHVFRRRQAAHRRAARRVRRALHRGRLARLESARTSSSSTQAKHRTFQHARLAAFGSTRRKDIAAPADDQVRLLLDAETPVVTIFGKTWLLHVREVLQTTPEENLAMIADTVRYLKAHGRFVVYDAEHAFDGYKDDPRVRAGDAGRPPSAAGADVVVAVRHQRRLAAGRDRRDHARRARAARRRASASTRTTTSASASPTRWPRSTPARRTCRARSTAIGERTGNCNLTSVIPILQFKLKQRVGAGRVAGAC